PSEVRSLVWSSSGSSRSCCSMPGFWRRFILDGALLVFLFPSSDPRWVWWPHGAAWLSPFMRSESGPAFNPCRCAGCRIHNPGMIETRLRFQVCIATTFLVLLVPRFAEADGGIIRLQKVQGPFSITVFSSPEAASGGLTDVSALIQERESGKVILDADVRLALVPPDGSALNPSDALCAVPGTGARPLQGPSSPTSVRATREQASNKLLYSAPVELNVPGNW